MSATVNIGTIEGLLRWKADDAALRKSLDDVAKKADVSRGQLSQYNREIDSVNKTYQKVAASLDPATAAEQKYEKANIALSTALKHGIIDQGEYNKQLDLAKKKFEDSANSLEAYGKAVSQVGDKMSAAGRGLTASLTVPILAIGGVAVKSFGDFDDAMAASLAIMGDVSSTMKNQLSDSAREVAKTTTFSAAESAKAYFFLASAGLSAEQSMAALPKVAAFAQAGNFGLERATSLLANAQSSLGLRTADATKNMENMVRVSDVLTRANILADATTEQFAISLTTKAANAMKQLNISVESGVAVLAAWADQGIKGEIAGERFSIVTRDLQTHAIKNANAFKRWGVEVYDSTGKFKPFADIIQSLEKALGGYSDKAQKAILLQLGFSDRSVDATRSLIGLSDKIRQYETQLQSAGGVTDEVAKKQLQSFEKQMELIKHQITDTAITLGAALVPSIKDFASNVVVPAIQKLTELSKKFAELPESTRHIIVVMAGIVAATGPVLLILGSLLKTIGSLIAIAPLAGVAIETIVTALLAFGGIPAIIAAVGVALNAMVSAWSARMDEATAKLVRFQGEATKYLGTTDQLKHSLKVGNVSIETLQSAAEEIGAIRRDLKSLTETALPEATRKVATTSVVFNQLSASIARDEVERIQGEIKLQQARLGLMQKLVDKAKELPRTVTPVTPTIPAPKLANPDISLGKIKHETDLLAELAISLQKVDNAREALGVKSQNELVDTQRLLTAQLTSTAAYEDMKRVLEGVKQERALIAPLATEENNVELKVAETIKKLDEQLKSTKISYSQWKTRKEEAEAAGRREIAVIESTIRVVKLHAQEIAIDRAVMEDWAKGQKVATEAAQDWGLHVGKVFLDMITLKKSLNDKLSASNASFIDWQTETAFAEKYGTGLEAIYQKYGLLSKASEELTIQEEIRKEIEKEGLNNGLPWFEGQIAEVEKVIRGYHALNDTIASAHAAAEIQKNVNQPMLDGVKAWESAGVNAFNTWLETGKFDAQSLMKTFLDITIKMIEEWLARWYAAIAARTAAEIAGNQAAAASGGSSGGGSGGMMGFAGSAMSKYFTGGGAGAGSSTSAYAGAGVAMGATIAIFVAVYALAKNWIDHHQREFEQIRIGAGGIGGLGSSLGSMKAGADHLGAVATEMIKTVTGIIDSLGGVIEGWTGDLTVSRSGHGKHTQYWVQYANGLIQQFGNDAEAAMQFATIQALKQSNIGGLPAEVQRAIHDSTAKTIDQINQEIVQAYQDVAARLGSVGQQVYDIFRKYATTITDKIKQAFTDMQALLLSVPHPGTGSGSGPGFGSGGGSSPLSADDQTKSLLSTKSVESITAEIKAVTDLIATRNREVESVDNSLLGISDASSKRLADIGSFNRGIEESQNLVNAQIQLVQQELASLGDKGGEAADHLRAVLTQYLAELQKIPEAITGQKLDMAIFDTLYQYLRASPKYAAEAAKWAKVKVEIEFAQIKLQLQLLGKWEEFMGMFNDAYNAAMQLAGKPQTHTGGGSGKSGVVSFIADRQFQLALANMDSLHQKLAQINRDYEAQIKAAGHDKKLRQELIALQHQEVAAAIAANKRTVLDQFQQLVHPNDSFSALEKQYSDMSKSVVDAGFAAKRTAKMLAELTAAEDKAIYMMSQTQAATLFGDLAGVITDATLKNKLLAEQEIINFQLKQIGMREEYELLLAKGKLTKAEIDLFGAAFHWIDAHTDDLPGGKNWVFGGAATALTSSAAGLSSAANSQSQAASALQSAVQSLEGYETSLRTDASLGMVDPRTALANAKADYEAIAAKALMGDADSIAKFKDVAETYRKDLVAFSPSSELIANVLSGISDTIDRIESIPAVAAAMSPDTLAITSGISDVSNTITSFGSVANDNLKSIDTSAILMSSSAGTMNNLQSTAITQASDASAANLQELKNTNSSLADLSRNILVFRRESSANSDELFVQLKRAADSLDRIAQNTRATHPRAGTGG